MKSETDLRHALRQLSASLPQAPDPSSQARLRAAFRARRKRIVWRWSALAAAACLSTACLAWLFATAPQPPASSASQIVHTSVVDPASMAGFVALPYGQSDVPLEDATVVLVQVRSGHATVNAELLVGQDGIARAVRLAQ